MSSMVPLVSSDPGTSGAAPPVLGPQPTQLPSNMQLSRNPMLPQHPLGAYTDAQYEAQNAILRNNIAKQYADILQKLGYTDDNGNFVQGSVEAEANKQRGDLRRSADLAAEDVTHQHQQLGTLFSGLRGTDQARAEYPYTQGLADLETQTPLTLSDLYEKAGGLIGDYNLQDNQLIADAASRRAAALQIPGGGGDTGDGGAGATDPNAPPNSGPGAAAPADYGTGPYIGTLPGGFGGATGTTGPTPAAAAPAAPLDFQAHVAIPPALPTPGPYIGTAPPPSAGIHLPSSLPVIAPAAPFDPRKQQLNQSLFL